MEAAMTETRNYHREITEERDRLRVERDELLKALKAAQPYFASGAVPHIQKQMADAIALAEGRTA
jgi:SpoVK/Ycf46/Vps4 family AAA+-type ATPase